MESGSYKGRLSNSVLSGRIRARLSPVVLCNSHISLERERHSKSGSGTLENKERVLSPGHGRHAHLRDGLLQRKRKGHSLGD